jgi:hypothetical protein
MRPALMSARPPTLMEAATAPAGWVGVGRGATVFVWVCMLGGWGGKGAGTYTREEGDVRRGKGTLCGVVCTSGGYEPLRQPWH